MKMKTGGGITPGMAAGAMGQARHFLGMLKGPAATRGLSDEQCLRALASFMPPDRRAELLEALQRAKNAEGAARYLLAREPRRRG